MGLQRLPLIEPVPVEYDLCTELALIEGVGDFGACFILCAEDTLHETGERVRLIKRKIVLPTEAIVPGIELTLGFLAKNWKRRLGSGVLQLVS